MAKFTCPECGEKFTAPPSWGKTFCSRKCSGASLSRRYKGQKPSPQCIEAVKNSNKKRALMQTKEYRRKMSRSVKEVWENRRGPMTGRTGKSNPNWKHGKYEGIDYKGSGHSYASYWNTQADKARERDGNKCAICGKRYKKRKIGVHHIAEDGFNDPLDAHDLSNLITLCQSCHRKVHKGIIQLPHIMNIQTSRD